MNLLSAQRPPELAVKVMKGTFPQAAPLVANFVREVAAEGFSLLDITTLHALRAGGLERHHDDPFDRMLIAQSLIEGLPLVSKDKGLDVYGTSRLW